jgi:hypothetical protein
LRKTHTTIDNSNTGKSMEMSSIEPSDPTEDIDHLKDDSKNVASNPLGNYITAGTSGKERTGRNLPSTGVYYPENPPNKKTENGRNGCQPNIYVS